MRKILALLIAVSMSLIACSAELDNIETSFDFSDEESFESSAASAELSELTEDSVDVSESTSEISFDETSEASKAESSEETSEDSQPTVVDVEAIVEEIAGMAGNAFTTNMQMSETIQKLETYLNKTEYGVFYCDLNFENYVAFGNSREFRTASTAKLPYVKYLCMLADKGEVDLDERLIYEDKFKDMGSGILKKETPGGLYSVETLMEYALKYSDNIAYKMLLNRYGVSDYNDYVEEMGVDYSTGSSGYTNCNSAQMAALLFDIAHYDGEHKDIITEAGSNASFNYQIGYELSEYTVVQKYGAMKPGNTAYHDIAIVYAEVPYILVIYTTIDYESANKNVPFREIARMVDDINKEANGL